MRQLPAGPVQACETSPGPGFMVSITKSEDGHLLGSRPAGTSQAAPGLTLAQEVIRQADLGHVECRTERAQAWPGLPTVRSRYRQLRPPQDPGFPA